MKLVNKEGRLTQNAINFAYEMVANSTEGTATFYGKEVRGRGRYRTLNCTRHSNAKELLQLLDVHYWEGNDGPRGGKTWDYFRFHVSELLNAVANYKKEA